MQQHKTLTKFSSINVLLRNLTAGYAQLKAKRIEIVSLFIVVVAMASYFNPQAAIDLWLSKDQQAQIHFNQGDYDKAALTFNDQRWAAYSHYLNGNFTQSAALYSQFNDMDALFAQANANAHSFQYLVAKQQYQDILQQGSQHKLNHSADNNLRQVEHIIANISADMKNENSNDSSKNQILNKNKKQRSELKKDPSNIKKRPSDKIWLEQIQKDPGVFLQKKFQQEYNRKIQIEVDKESEK